MGMVSSSKKSMCPKADVRFEEVVAKPGDRYKRSAPTMEDAKSRASLTSLSRMMTCGVPIGGGQLAIESSILRGPMPELFTSEWENLSRGGDYRERV
ncbi:hypothetical protein R1flu_017122 [Riccia fluitans]|uniref:Uncharacterized protein n=1 Tax=Riccia fluitans TaxID=41844 RepID=A0ABD1YPB2_9MARC